MNKIIISVRTNGGEQEALLTAHNVITYLTEADLDVIAMQVASARMYMGVARRAKQEGS